MGLGTILQAFCCRITAFVKNPKYSHMPGNHVGPEERLQGQETTADDIEAAKLSEGPSNDVAMSPDRRDEPDRLL